jgi:hypothetical protein
MGTIKPNKIETFWIMPTSYGYDASQASLMELRHLRYFVAVAESSSFRSSAGKTETDRYSPLRASK